MPMNIWRRLGSPLLLSAIVLLAACAPPGVVQAERPVLDEPPRGAPYPHELLAIDDASGRTCGLSNDSAGGNEEALFPTDGSLEGDPGFDPSRLPDHVRCWYEELWTVLQNPDRSSSYTGRAARDDLYLYARPLNTHMTALMTALRVTGDLALLDEVDRLAQHMRSRLEDRWRGPAAFDSEGVDGYLNWVWGQSGSAAHTGRDVHEIDEMRTHAMVAQFAWAFAINADVSSPNGVDYAERAQFWTDYLVEHFEAKWRERNGTAWPEFPFLSRPHLHETVDFVRYHTYLHRLTGKEEYAAEARRLSEIVFDNFVEVEADGGPALVTPRSVLSMGGEQDYMIPSTYVRYVFASAVDLHFENVGEWAEKDVMTMLARSLAEFIIDNGSDDFARDIGGGTARGGVAASDEDRWGRFDEVRFSISPYALLSAWDESDRVAEVAMDVFDSTSGSQRDVFIPTALMLDAALN